MVYNEETVFFYLAGTTTRKSVYLVIWLFLSLLGEFCKNISDSLSSYNILNTWIVQSADFKSMEIVKSDTPTEGNADNESYLVCLLTLSDPGFSNSH